MGRILPRGFERPPRGGSHNGDDIVTQSWPERDRIMARYFPVVPISYGGIAMAHGSRIMGMHDDSVLGMPTWDDIWVAPAT
jgi:hypothetical protein